MNFEYDRRPVFANLILWTIVSFWLIVLVALIPNGLGTMGPVLIVVLLLAVVILGVSPLITYHEITDDRIVLRQGWHFVVRMDISNIKKIYRMERVEIKEGVLLDLFNRVLVLTGVKVNGIGIELKNEMRIPLAMGKKVDRIVFDVMDTETFLKEFERRL